MVGLPDHVILIFPSTCTDTVVPVLHVDVFIQAGRHGCRGALESEHLWDAIEADQPHLRRNIAEHQVLFGTPSLDARRCINLRWAIYFVDTL